MDDRFLKPYDPQESEDAIYERWEKSGYFNPNNCVTDDICKKDAEPFSIVLPPPNVTGTLHMGHAAMLAIQDILIRFERMRGKRTLWLPGTDHAAIATASKVEKEINKKEKKNRHDLGREEFLKRVESFAQESHDTIVNQLKKMGSSLDWSREAFTLDEARSHAVFTAFKDMYDAGLIYRAARIVNWDPKGQTTISDDEVVHEEREATLYTFHYWEGFPIPIATTRPETKVGDTAVAVHPDDKRYQEYVGQTFTGEFAGTTLTIKVIADDAVEPDFGTGALGVTPAHSYTDWEMAERHDLPQLQVINEYAKMTDEAGSLVAGLKVLEAREQVVAWLREQNLLESEERVAQNVSTSERTGAIVEPLPKLQWWIDTEKPFALKDSVIDGIPSNTPVTLKQIMRHVVTTGQIKLDPERFERTYLHWIDNLRPWCISRQIWYGHRIPVWYHEPKCIPIHGREDEVSQCEMIKVSLEKPSCEHCQAGYTQDPDTLDTWFSSGLWTFSILGWPEKTEDLATYHPTSVLETGYDILFFWVARMILMSGFHMGDVPFKNVYLHGLVRDEKGKKMSKSLGNIIDPLDMIEKYGADATRLSLIIGAAPGNDIRLSEKVIKGYKNFANKIWNITRFVLENVDSKALNAELTDADEELLQEAQDVATEVTKNIEQFRLDLAGSVLYHYVWDRFAAHIIEDSKVLLKEGGDSVQPSPDLDTIASKKRVLWEIWTICLKLLHPFMPFVTEEIWSRLPTNKEQKLLMVERWPA